MKKFQRSSDRRRQGSGGSRESTRRVPGVGSKMDPSRPASGSVEDMQEREEFVWQELEEFVAGDEKLDLGVSLDQERWWSLLVQAVGGPDRLPKA
ncbi:MAG: hypothetical protein CBC48_02555 [bacterium TMED88]|nr:hypothetical protein [Deltaproteobacteria bacterium]OUV36235.1 MAG: hypothetical protein CBC48_02555 [bacterium TMED88]